MTTEEQIQTLIEIVDSLRESLLGQQTMIDKLTKHSGQVSQVVTQNANQAMKNDEALLKRIQHAESVINGMLARERKDVVTNVGKSE